MAHKKGAHEEHMDESWLIPYADLLTLLLALFIVLFATSNADTVKMSAMAQAFFLEYNGVLPEIKTGTPTDGGEFDGGLGEFDLFPTPSPSDGDDKVSGLITDLQDAFMHYVENNHLEGQMKIVTKKDGLLVVLTSDVWFASGSAAIDEAQKATAGQIAGMIESAQTNSGIKLQIIVSGHTDNRPIDTREFPNNWRLSAIRALNFMEELMATSSLAPSAFSARGFGEYEPVDTNDTPEGRQHNRRVEVFISPDALLDDTLAPEEEGAVSAASDAVPDASFDPFTPAPSGG